MKALRWILFSLLAFGLGTGVALALHPPTVGIPTATASRLSDDLAKIQEYAAAGNCNAVRGRLNGAAAKIDKLPERTATATVEQLNDSLATVRSQALRACQQANSARIAKEQAEAEAQATPTPQVEPTPAPEVEPTIAPDVPTPEPGPGDGATTPQDPSGGADIGGDQSQDDPTGGITIPGQDAVRQQVDKERRKWEKRADQIRKALEH